MGFNDGMKKVLINIVILTTWFVSSIGSAIYIRLYDFDSSNYIVTYQKLIFVFNFPFSLAMIYISYTLRDKLVFNITFYYGVVILVVRLFTIFLGENFSYYNSFVDGTITINLALALFIVLFGLSYIYKERKLVVVYFGMSLFQLVITKIRMSDYLINSNNFPNYYDGELILIFAYFNMIIYIISMGILLVIFNQDGIQFYKSKEALLDTEF